MNVLHALLVCFSQPAGATSLNPRVRSTRPFADIRGTRLPTTARHSPAGKNRATKSDADEMKSKSLILVDGQKDLSTWLLGIELNN